jgi:mono/diheme cytochrome c family protein
MNRSFAAIRPATLTLALLATLGTGARVPAADEIDAAVSAAGKVWYEKYCMPCHGPGGAPGEAVSRATKEPVDLRTYVAGHGGTFPANDWLAVTADIRPGGVHAKVWRTIEAAQPGVAGKEAAARGVLGSIARYIMSVQRK